MIGQVGTFFNFSGWVLRWFGVCLWSWELKLACHESCGEFWCKRDFSIFFCGGVDEDDFFHFIYSIWWFDSRDLESVNSFLSFLYLFFHLHPMFFLSKRYFFVFVSSGISRLQNGKWLEKLRVWGTGINLWKYGLSRGKGIFSVYLVEVDEEGFFHFDLMVWFERFEVSFHYLRNII